MRAVAQNQDEELSRDMLAVLAEFILQSVARLQDRMRHHGVLFHLAALISSVSLTGNMINKQIFTNFYVYVSLFSSVCIKIIQTKLELGIMIIIIYSPVLVKIIKVTDFKKADILLISGICPHMFLFNVIPVVEMIRNG